MLEVAALLVIMGTAQSKAPTFTLHRFERAELCEATAQTIVEAAHARNRITLWRGQVTAWCIPAEPSQPRVECRHAR